MKNLIKIGSKLVRWLSSENHLDLQLASQSKHIYQILNLDGTVYFQHYRHVIGVFHDFGETGLELGKSKGGFLVVDVIVQILGDGQAILLLAHRLARFRLWQQELDDIGIGQGGGDQEKQHQEKHDVIQRGNLYTGMGFIFSPDFHAMELWNELCRA